MSYSRRAFIKASALAAALSENFLMASDAPAQTVVNAAATIIQTAALTIAYEDHGSPQGVPIFLLHGFPDDVRAWDGVVAPLVKAGYRTIVPYLRGYGPTRFRDATAPRVAEQAAIGQDLIDLADALKVQRFVVVGYDWGGRAAGIAAALHPDRVRGAVLIGGYTIQNTVAPPPPGDAETERALWYQWYFNTERGRAGLEANRRGICRLLWETWSPTWRFTDETFNRTAVSFDNPDFVAVVIHSYRHRYGNAPGDPRFTAIEQELARHPKIQIPAITLYGANDGVARMPPDPSIDRDSFTSLVDHIVVPGAGHFLPRESPDIVSAAVLKLLDRAR
jgi:pimeloyl-ACP methyl ester carboxylesterase